MVEEYFKMKIYDKIIKILIFITITFGSPPALSKVAAIIIDYDTKKILFEKNADTLNYPASLTKMMTLYIVFDYLKKGKLAWNTEMKVSSTAASRSPSKLNLKVGSTILVKDAVNALIIKSANDVATVVAEHIAITERKFAKLMNKYANSLGMSKTTFKNASGLPNKAQMTTARDMSKLSYELISNFPNEYKLFSKEKFEWQGKTYKTHNRLMQSYIGGDGIKTGYIRASGFQLAFSAVRENKRLIGIYFGGNTGKQRNQRLKILMDLGYKNINVYQKEISSKNKIVKQKNNNKKKFIIVVGTFKYKKNAERQLRLIRSKYPKTTNNKISEVSLIKNKGNHLYESRFHFFSIKDAKLACSRLKKYKRDCFIRG